MRSTLDRLNSSATASFVPLRTIIQELQLAGSAGNLKVSNSPGHTFSSYGSSGQPTEKFFMFNIDHNSVLVPGGVNREKVTLSSLYVGSESNFTSPIRLQTLLNLPPNFQIYGQSVSQNTFVVTTLPDPVVYPGLLNSFKDSSGNQMAFMFYCAN